MRESNGIDFNFHCSGGDFASLDPAGNDRFATSQNTVLQDPLYIAIFGKTVMIYWLKVEAT